MPVLTLLKPASRTSAGIWHILEKEEELAQMTRNPDEAGCPTVITHPLKRKQWLACRIILQHIAGMNVEVFYNENGKPMAGEAGLFISFSHSGEYAAAMIGDGIPVGIDIEVIKPRIFRVARHFLNKEELDALADESGDPARLYVYWCAKEAIFKLFGKPGTDFRNDITIHPFDYLCNVKDFAKASLRSEDQIRPCMVYYQKLGNLMIAMATTSNNIDH